jgi:hypothetical protein
MGTKYRCLFVPSYRVFSLMGLPNRIAMLKQDAIIK